AEALNDAADDLALDDGRVDDLADVVHGDVALDGDLTRLRVDFDLGNVDAVGVDEVGRVVIRVYFHAGLQVVRQVVGGVGGKGQLAKGLGLAGHALDIGFALFGVVDDVVERRFELVRGNL